MAPPRRARTSRLRASWRWSVTAGTPTRWPASTSPPRSAGSPPSTRSASTSPASTSKRRSGRRARPPARRSKAVKEQLRSVPAAGFHYGLLRWLDPDGAARLGALPAPQILFNYGGRSDLGRRPPTGTPPPTTSTSATAATPCRSATPSRSTPKPPIPAPARSSTSPGHWPTGVLDRAEVGDAGRSCTSLRCRGWWRTPPHPAPGAQTPSDFPLVRLTQADLDELEGRVGPLADVLPATPLQEGFFFHSVLEDGHDPYLPQFVFDAGGQHAPVDPVRLRRSLEALLDRHPNLRAGFCQLASSGTVVSVVPAEAPVPWREVDLAAVPDTDQAAAVARLAEEDLAAGFDQGRPPLLRATLADLGEGRSRLVLTSHHALMDGWSLPLFFDELTRIYDSRRRRLGARARPAVPGLPGLAGRAGSRRRAGRLAGGAGRAGRADTGGARIAVRPGAAVDRGRTARGGHDAALTEAARRRHLTMNSVVQAAWAAVLELRHRPGRRGLRRHGGRAAAGARRYRVDDRPVHQHRARPGLAAARRAAAGDRRTGPGRPGPAPRPPPPRAVEHHPGGGRRRRAVRHAGRLRELPRPRRCLDRRR